MPITYAISRAANYVNGEATQFEYVVSPARQRWDPELLYGTGRCAVRVGKYVLSPGAQWAAGGQLFSNLIFEGGVFQSVGTLLTKAREYLRLSTCSMNVLVFKIWYDPLPSKVAMVAALWCKQGCVVKESDYRAVQFVSFGNRPPSAAEIAEFNAVTERGMQAPQLTGVTGGSNHVVSSEINKKHPALQVHLPATVLFAVPELIGPNRYFALPDVVFHLTKAKTDILAGIVSDICQKHYKLSLSELQLIVSDADVQASHGNLYKFAVRELDALTK